MVTNRTTNEPLQNTLNLWRSQLELIAQASSGNERNTLLEQFVRGFVPTHDITEDDITHYMESLSNDEEFFQSLFREISQCCSGDRVESIDISPVKGKNYLKAVYVLLPPVGLGND